MDFLIGFFIGIILETLVLLLIEISSAKELTEDEVEDIKKNLEDL